MTPDEVAKRLVVLKILADQVKAAREELAEVTRDTWRPSTRIPAELPDGSLIGAVTLAHGRVQVNVTDPAGLAAWVRENHPGELEETVRTAFLNALKSRAAEGEVIPGITAVDGRPYPMVKPTSDAPVLVAEAWQTGALDWTVVPQITEGTTGETGA